MQATAAAREEGEPEGPVVRGISGPARDVRLRPAFKERLRAAKVELIGRFRIDTDEQHVFDQFFEEAFEPWLRSKLDPPAPSPPPTPRRAKKDKPEGGER